MPASENKESSPPLIQETELSDSKHSTNWRETLQKGAEQGLSILNGIVGDYLQENQKELAIPMQFYYRGQPLSLSTEALQLALPQASSRVCLLVHGLASNESIWNFPEAPHLHYGSLLQQDFGYTSLALRYNSGLHISENGKTFSGLLETFVQNYPSPVEDLVVIAHSMGGLVTRSAGLVALQSGALWPKKVKKIIFLGSPHQGSPWEKAGNFVASVMEAVPRPYMKLAAEVANLRSAGIKDLRFGYVAEDDWKGYDPDALWQNTKQPAPLLPETEYYVISGILTESSEHLVAQWIGDALVRSPSARGESSNEAHHLPFPPENHREFSQMGHLQLAHSPEVYAQLKLWCALPESELLQPSALPAAPVASRASGAGLQQVKGLVNFLQTAIDQGTTAVEKVHEALAAEPFAILNQVPVVAAVAQVVQPLQQTITSGVYQAVRLINQGIGETAQALIPEDSVSPKPSENKECQS